MGTIRRVLYGVSNILRVCNTICPSTSNCTTASLGVHLTFCGLGTVLPADIWNRHAPLARLTQSSEEKPLCLAVKSKSDAHASVALRLVNRVLTVIPPERRKTHSETHKYCVPLA